MPANDFLRCVGKIGDHIGWHYDTSYYAGRRYTLLIGLIDRSSCRLDYQLHTRERGAKVVPGCVRIPPGGLVFFDGEEALHEWTDTDSLYGSRHLAQKWNTDGTNRRLKGLINIDMTGDKNLRLVYDGNSAPSLRKLVWDVADSLGYSTVFPRQASGIEDDHFPFLKAGVRAVDLIDFDSQTTFWHTPKDTMDKLDPHSFEIVGAVVMKSIGELEQQK